jgi:hypothetical protein
MMMTNILMRRAYVVLIAQVGILDISIVFIGIRSGGAVVGDDQQLSLVGVILMALAVAGA